MFRTLILLILVLYCTHKNTHPFLYLSDEKPLAFSFAYGEKPQEGNAEHQRWGTVYSIQEGKLCLGSAAKFYTEAEYGPQFHFCFDKDETSNAVLKDALDNLYIEEDFHNVSWIGHIQGEAVLLSFLKTNDINKQIKEERLISYSLGDISISTEGLSELVKGIHFVKNYSAPYFSLLNFETRSLLLIPSLNTSPTQRKYLTIEFSTTDQLHRTLRNFVSQAIEKNHQLKNECKQRSLVLTEALFSEHSKGKFFIELTNNSDESICFSKLEIGTNTYTEVLNYKAGFLFPKQSILLTAKGSHLDGLVLSDKFWKEVRSDKKLIYTNGVDMGDYDFTSLSFSFGSLYFSHTPGGINSCRYKKAKLYNWSDLCGTGMEKLITNLEVEACNPTDFILTEFNPFGIQKEASTDYHDKFIELLYNGKTICSIYDLKLVVSNEAIPLDDRMIKPSEIIVVGLARNYQVTSLIERSLYSLTLYSTVQLESSSVSKTLWSLSEPDLYVFQLDSRKRLHSIVPKPTYIELHPAYLSEQLSEETKSYNHSSPGQWIEPANPLSFEWNEISWMGSYNDNGDSLADDEFLELKTEGTGSIEIHIIEGEKVKKYLVPISIEDMFTVISRKNFTCFAFPYTVQNSSWNLPNANAEIVIFYKGLYQKNFIYSAEEGINDTSNKKRASFSYTGYMDVWKNSGGFVSNGYALCENTHASPGKENHFLPDISIDILSQNQATVNVIQSVYDTSQNLNLLLYSIEPTAKQTYSLSTKEKNTVNLDSFYPNSLVYAKIYNQEELFSINRSGLSIDSIHPGSSGNSSLDWFRFCNYGSSSFDLQYLQVHDSYSGGGITKLENRNLALWEILKNQYTFKDGYILEPNECAFVIDPQIQNHFLLNVEEGKQFLLFTPITQNSIGNGLSQTDSIDIYLPINGNNTHLASFQNIHSHSPFVFTTPSGQLTLLKKNKQGTKKSDYRSILWD